MLVDEYQHTLDAKGRVSFPAKLREELGEHFYINRDPEHCLCCYSEQSFKELAARYASLPVRGRALQRAFFAGTSEVDVDTSGRILLSQGQREYAGITRDVMIIGVANRVEIWDLAAYREYMARQIEQDAVSLESMEELGF